MLSRFKALSSSILAEWRALGRHKMVFLILLGVPVIYPLLVSCIYVKDQAGERPTLLVDQDNSALSRELATRLDATEEVRVIGRPESLEKAFDQVRSQDVEMLVYVPPGFSKQVKRGERSEVRVWAGAGNMYAYGLSFLAFNKVLLDLNEELGTRAVWRKGVPPGSAEGRVLPLAWEDRPLYHPAQSYGSFLVPGVLLVVIQQVVLISLAFSVGWQREDGDLTAAVRFPFTHLEGKAIAHLGFWIAGIALIVFGIFPLFGWPVRSPFGLFLVYSALALAMIPPAICVSSFTTDRFVAFQLLLFFSAPVFMMSGYSWPLWRMPEGIERLAWIFPATPALQAVRILSLKSADLSLIAGPMRQLALQMAVWTVIAVACAHLGQRARARRAARSAQQPAPALSLPCEPT